ncbi:4168_t:CDS:2 [Ambispora gerdemannii]|uniref:4168_t:CDS:1 n=1 Tax=Ambispora gerdemannii TaxID=144530 RepID=A0A9N9FG77_9GLOM|nr:4168_t:CDS:2 [Ambispora gerdemannii]
MPLFPEAFGAILCLCSLICILLVNISEPIARGVYFIEINFSDYNYKVGLWGWCRHRQEVECTQTPFASQIKPIQSQNSTSSNSTADFLDEQSTLGYLKIFNIFAALSVIIVSYSVIKVIRRGTPLNNDYLKVTHFCFFSVVFLTIALIVDVSLFKSVVDDDKNIDANWGGALWALVSAYTFMVINGGLFYLTYWFRNDNGT